MKKGRDTNERLSEERFIANQLVKRLEEKFANNGNLFIDTKNDLEWVDEHRETDNNDKLLEEWQHRLRLDDWKIDVKWDCPLTDFELKDVCGESVYEETNKSAIIRIMSEKDYGERLIPYDAERILVHELLHCKLCYIQETENETQNRLVHGYIEDLARALVDAKTQANKK